MFPKLKRVRSEELLKHIRNLACAACGRFLCDAAHIRSKGAGGGDVLSNLIPLCRPHHIEQHAHGWVYMWSKYPSIKRVLQDKGWEVIDEMGKEKLEFVEEVI